MKILKFFIIKFTLCILLVPASNAAAMVVESPTLLAQMTAQFKQLYDSYKKYVEILEAANKQIENLQKVNSYMQEANKIVNGHSLNFANPLDVYENAKNQLESMKYNYEALKRSVNDYDIKSKLANKRLQEKCPFYAIDKIGANDTTITTNDTGEESEDTKFAYEVLEEFTDITRNQVNAVSSPLQGMALAIVMCDEIQRQTIASTINKYEAEAHNAFMRGDYATYNNLKAQKAKKAIEYEKKMDKEFQEKNNQLMVRAQTMMTELGVTDPTQAQKNGIEYCRKDGKGGCHPILLSLEQVKAREKELLDKAVKNSNGETSQTSAEREQIMIDYLREIASHIAFLNKTMVLQAEYIGSETARKEQNLLIAQAASEGAGLANNQAMFKATEDNKKPTQQPNVDKYGFPTSQTKKPTSSSGL
ncbi:hypothetical protein LS71_008330 [Helicobacter jaachi]|uniref:Sodium:calcium antiporter n=1 Tax=Helicobacter jaachi TaxID=1677920 RepID=A0A4U8T7B3_9HELI|nr:hypothetical protein [Helicobacter jaachi]TLD95404.1 hypothetical protein LS71_008330 [Helicobacter jaachi]